MVGMNYGCPLHHSPDFMFDWLARKNIRYLSTRPGMAELLAEAALAKGIRPKLEALLTVGGPLTQEVRDICLKAFGLPIRDTYGSTECGNMALDCPQCGVLHLNEEGALFEIVRDDGSACTPGETGRLLVTPFFNYAMPLVRYDTGDYAELAAGPNPCGRPHRSLRRVLGRETEAFVRRDGSRFFPSVAARSCAPYLAFEQLQFVQTDYETLELRYVRKPGTDRLDRAGLEHYVRGKVGAEFAIVLAPVTEILRGPRAKFLYHLCEVPRPAPKLLAGSGRH
jgi:phenylacetate-CoA ligase